MKKTIAFLIIPLISLGLLTACGKSVPDIKDRVAEDTQQELVYSGIIEPLEIDMYKEGTHQIRTDDDQLVIIQSQSVDLNKYLEKRVRIKGRLTQGTGGEYIFNVSEAEFEDSTLSGEPQDFENKMYGFRFTYPGTWLMTEEDSGLYFNTKDFKIVEIKIFENQEDLDGFVSSQEDGEGTPVTIGAQRSLRFSDDSSIRVYVPNPPRKKVFLITFNEGGEDIDAQKEFFYDFLETFQPIYASSQQGEACGGKDNVKCAENYFCELESTEAEAEGVCVAVGEQGKETDCPYIPMPTGCRDYRVAEYAKTTGCPTRYECVNGESADEEKTEETTDTSALIGTIEKYQAQILGIKDTTIIQYEITDSDDLICIVYESEGKKFKTLYSYAPSANEFNFIEKAHFEQGEDRDWTLVSGEDIQTSSGKTVIKAGEGNTDEPIKVSEDMRLYENEQKGFSMEYPENWYYRSFGTLNDSRWTAGFSDKPLDYLSDAKITLSIVPDGTQKSSGTLYSVTRDGDDGSVFVIEGPEDMKETIDKMAESILF
jgi:hypothetical protein